MTRWRRLDSEIRRFGCPTSVLPTALLIGFSLVNGGVRASEPASSYAPAERIGRQIDFFQQRVTKSLANRDSYDAKRQEQVQRDADTIAVLAAVLSAHDQDHPLRPRAVVLMKRAQQLAESADDWETAKGLAESLGQVQPGDREAIDWSGVADLYRLMHQVPIVFNEVRRGASSRRFKRTAEKTADFATTLAALAQVSHFNQDYCDDDAAHAEWKAMCLEMRDAATAVRTAADRNDQDKAKAEAKRLDRSCNTCHKRFRD